VPEKTIQAVLRHANVSTTNTYYIKSAADDARVAMAKLEKLVTGNELLKSGNEVTIEAADTRTALTQ
jgi:5-bromo-4-chloroindolyl phosphate hydrolysis protein